MTLSERLRDRLVVLAAAALGGISLLGFGLFLLLGGFEVLDLGWSEGRLLAWDGALSLAFFLQHSGMARRGWRRWLATATPEVYHGALYSIASGVALLALLVLWQTSGITILRLEGLLRWAARGLFILSVLGFWRGVHALGSLDAFGVDVLRDRLRGRRGRDSEFAVRGPYRWVRHPLYTAVLGMIWSCPDVTADRLLFNLLWTAWIALATVLEERDLVFEFGDAYRDYQRRVPMLLPWRRDPG